MKKEWNFMIIGVVLGVVFFLIVNSFIVRDSGVSFLEGDRTEFSLSDVHLKTAVDFPTGVPIYDADYCTKKYLELYESEAKDCIVKAVKTVARTNPLVRDVSCSCN